MKEIFVYADWEGLDSRTLMGVLSTDVIRGEEVFSFEYSKDWLKLNFSCVIDPDLNYFRGKQFLNKEKLNFGIFQDSSPDRWGRLLMRRRSAILNSELGLTPNRFFESDYLLGVNDETRQGGIRFKLEEKGDFLANDTLMKTPPFTSIRELEQASLRMEEEDFITDPNAKKWLNMIFAPGSSLGGARPKANVISPNGDLWIAKFPSKNDDYNSGLWEYIVSQMALELDIKINESKATRFSQKNHTYLVKRFDRFSNKRIHFASAMTLLDHTDGYNYKEGASFLEFVEIIESYGGQPEHDLMECGGE